MGCGLSQLSRVHRIQVLDGSAGGGGGAAELASSSQRPVTRSSKIKSRSPTPVLDAAKPTNPSPPAIYPPNDLTLPNPSPPALLVTKQQPDQLLVANLPAAPETMPVLSPVPLQPILKDFVRTSSLSVKSLSDHDSGYKDDPDSLLDDSTSDSEAEGTRLKQSWRKGVFHSGLEHVDRAKSSPMPLLCQTVEETPSETHEPATPTSPMDGWGTRNKDQLGSTCCNMDLEGSGKCASCGFSHAKQDGYVETYDDGFVDSSYEELRSLTHEGSVFSLDIVCHTTMDGSHKAHKIPLFVHKPVQPMQQVYAEQRKKDRQIMIQKEKANAVKEKDKTIDFDHYLNHPAFGWQPEFCGGENGDQTRNREGYPFLQRTGSVSDANVAPWTTTAGPGPGRTANRRTRYPIPTYPHTHAPAQLTLPSRTTNLYGFAGIDTAALFVTPRPLTSSTLQTKPPSEAPKRPLSTDHHHNHNHANDYEITSLHD